MGIQSKNREEWVITAFACMTDSITIVPFYDTLGIDSIKFIFNQTELQTFSTEAKNLSKIFDLKG